MSLKGSMAIRFHNTNTASVPYIGYPLHPVMMRSVMLSAFEKVTNSEDDKAGGGWIELTLFRLRNRRHDDRPSHRHNRPLRRIGSGRSARKHFLLDKLHELLHLPLHFFHALAHLQDDRHPRNVHGQIAGQSEDELQPLQVFLGVEAGVAFGPRRLEQSFALVKAQRLRMNAIHLSHRRDHVCALRFTFGHNLSIDSRDDSRADSRIRSLFFLIHDPVHAAESRQTLTARAHPNRGGLLWTKIMLSVYWKVSSKPAKMDKRGTRTPLRT